MCVCVCKNYYKIEIRIITQIIIRPYAGDNSNDIRPTFRPSNKARVALMITQHDNALHQQIEGSLRVGEISPFTSAHVNRAGEGPSF